MIVQVFGQSGMLGSAVVRALPQTGLVFEPRSADLELVTPGHIHADVVINCAGLVKQRRALASRFMRVNAVGPHRLAEACDQAHARLIHVSTDCVFYDGPSDEDDLPDPRDVYALSKLAGEVRCAPHLTIRTSFIGWGPRGLLHDLQGAAPVKVSHRLWWSGHTVDTVAGLLLLLATRPDVTGLLHVPGEAQTRANLAERLKTWFDLPAPLLVDDDSYVANRRLRSVRWAALDLPALPPFDAQLDRMVKP